MLELKLVYSSLRVQSKAEAKKQDLVWPALTCGSGIACFSGPLTMHCSCWCPFTLVAAHVGSQDNAVAREEQ